MIKMVLFSRMMHGYPYCLARRRAGKRSVLTEHGSSYNERIETRHYIL